MPHITRIRRIKVSTHSRPKAAGNLMVSLYRLKLFQHTAARRRLDGRYGNRSSGGRFQHTAARRRLASTGKTQNTTKKSFNTQPPEGGWVHKPSLQQYPKSFNTQPPEGGWFLLRCWGRCGFFVSTHSRPKAAGLFGLCSRDCLCVSTHSRPKAAGQEKAGWRVECRVSTHSRPKAAGNPL